MKWSSWWIWFVEVTHLTYIPLFFFLYSSENGSPVDAVEDGALIATVTKKRRVRDGAAPVNFDIKVGDGQYISLSDPGNVQNMEDSLKSTAIIQLQVLQDQMASLMAQLKN